jgi:ribosomal subunit interface protein
MSLRVSGKNINIGEALRAHITERLEQAASKYFDGGVSGHVTITPEGSGYRADCSLHLTSGIVLQADGRAQEPYATFDQAADRLEKRLRRYKERLKGHHDGHGPVEPEVVPYQVFEAPDEESEAPAEFSPAVIVE